jgi:hypothetical protein
VAPQHPQDYGLGGGRGGPQGYGQQPPRRLG